MPPADPFVCGLVLGAGGSKRLGRPKQTLPYGDGTLLGHVVAVARECAFDQVVVAIGGAAGGGGGRGDPRGAPGGGNEGHGGSGPAPLAGAREGGRPPPR